MPTTKQPLTAAQLIAILVVIGIGILCAKRLIEMHHQSVRADQVAHCVVNAPLGWSSHCETDPTGYPGYTGQ